MGGSASIVLNAANEIAVAAFLDGKLAFTDIAHVIEQSLAHANAQQEANSLQEILDIDADARDLAQALVTKGQGRAAV